MEMAVCPGLCILLCRSSNFHHFCLGHRSGNNFVCLHLQSFNTFHLQLHSFHTQHCQSFVIIIQGHESFIFYIIHSFWQPRVCLLKLCLGHLLYHVNNIITFFLIFSKISPTRRSTSSPMQGSPLSTTSHQDSFSSSLWDSRLSGISQMLNKPVQVMVSLAWFRLPLVWPLYSRAR